MLLKKIPVYYALIALVAGTGLSFLIFHKGYFISQATAAAQVATNGNSASTNYCEIKTARQKGFDLISPLLLARPDCESPDFAPLKSDIMSLVENEKRSGVLSSASVYLMSLKQGDWMYYNPSEPYNPGSLIKVPLLITYLHLAESKPQVLSQELLYEPIPGTPVQTFNSAQIQAGHKYSVKDLFHYMVAYSDNNATRLLNENVDKTAFVQTFTNLNLPEPDIKDRNYQISARQYAKFFITLYNASYLSNEASEYAIELLSQCNFKQGMMKLLPPDVRVAHKFGEWADIPTNVHELHEAGIVYVNDSPYLVTIMTKGSDAQHLADVISRISKLVYDKMSLKTPAS